MTRLQPSERNLIWQSSCRMLDVAALELQSSPDDTCPGKWISDIIPLHFLCVGDVLCKKKISGLSRFVIEMCLSSAFISSATIA